MLNIILCILIILLIFNVVIKLLNRSIGNFIGCGDLLRNYYIFIKESRLRLMFIYMPLLIAAINTFEMIFSNTKIDNSFFDNMNLTLSIFISMFLTLLSLLPYKLLNNKSLKDIKIVMQETVDIVMFELFISTILLMLNIIYNLSIFQTYFELEIECLNIIFNNILFCLNAINGLLIIFLSINLFLNLFVVIKRIIKLFETFIKIETK